MVPLFGGDRPAEIKCVGYAHSFVKRSTGSLGLSLNRSEARAMVVESYCAEKFYGSAQNMKIESGVRVTSRCS
jgi:hypothetical protein